MGRPVTNPLLWSFGFYVPVSSGGAGRPDCLRTATSRLLIVFRWGCGGAGGGGGVSAAGRGEFVGSGVSQRTGVAHGAAECAAGPGGGGVVGAALRRQHRRSGG